MVIPGSRTSLNFDPRWEANIRSAREREALVARADRARVFARVKKLLKRTAAPVEIPAPAEILAPKAIAEAVVPAPEETATGEA